MVLTSSSVREERNVIARCTYIKESDEFKKTGVQNGERYDKEVCMNFVTVCGKQTNLSSILIVGKVRKAVAKVNLVIRNVMEAVMKRPFQLDTIIFLIHLL